MTHSFNDAVNTGQQGEAFCFENLSSLLSRYLVLSKTMCTQEHIEGGDYRILALLPSDEELTELPDWLPDKDLSRRAIPMTMYEGGVEVKTINNFLTRNNDNDEPSGTIGFELWSNANRNDPGWLYALCHPKAQRVRSKENKSVFPSTQPLALLFALKHLGSLIAVISFEDIPGLLDRLFDIAFECGVDLHKWNVPVGKAAEGWQPLNMLLIQNMWHVPFEKLADLASVTMVSEGIIVPKSEHDILLQHSRLDYLKKAAMHQLSDEKTDGHNCYYSC